MNYTAKTIRFNKSNKSQVALKAMNNFAEYGFTSANEMVMTALYELAERHDKPSQLDLPLDIIADKIAERLKGDLHIVADSSEAIGPSSTCPFGPAILDAPDSVSDSEISGIMADILSF